MQKLHKFIINIPETSQHAQQQGLVQLPFKFHIRIFWCKKWKTVTVKQGFWTHFKSKSCKPYMKLKGNSIIYNCLVQHKTIWGLNLGETSPRSLLQKTVKLQNFIQVSLLQLLPFQNTIKQHNNHVPVDLNSGLILNSIHKALFPNT
jgi:hypothetical protein